MLKNWLRWLLNKDELDKIGNELQMIRFLLQKQPEQKGPLGPIRAMGQ